MATCTRTVWKVLAGCQRPLLRSGAPTYTGVKQTAQRNLPVRTFAAVRALKKDKRQEAEKEPKKKEKPVIDDTSRHKPFGKTAWAPVDDVYVQRHYPRTVLAVADAVDMLKSFQLLDFTDRHQPVYMDLKLDMKLEKKKKVDAFVSTVHLPHPFKTELNTVLVFTEDADQVKVAQENGASVVGGVELIQPILDDEISADFYVAVPEILPKLTALKNKLRRKFPKSKRGAIDVNIPKMLSLFRSGHEILVEEEQYVRTQIATLDMPRDHILSNLRTVLVEVCSHRPANMGPFIQRAILGSHTSEALWFRSEDVLPKPVEKKKDEVDE